MVRALNFFLCISLATLPACGGRMANPIARHQFNDAQMPCAEILAEMSYAEQQINKLIPDSKKTGKNVALGAAGLFLIFPWFFMDMSSAEKAEIQAYQQRYLEMEKLYSRKGCDTALDPSQPAPSALPSQIDVKERLELLGQLYKEGLITDAEYNTRKQEILKSI